MTFILNNILKTYLNAGGNRTGDDGSEHSSLPRKEVIRRLRERGEAILEFGETEAEAFRRLRRCEIQEPEVNKVSLKCLSNN